MSSSVVLEVQRVSKKFARGFAGARRSALRDIWREIAIWEDLRRDQLDGSEFWALHEISFALHEGDALGIIGANGAGKSTLLKILSRLLKPDTGHVRIEGRVGTLIELGAGFNPVLTGRENVFAQGALYGYGVRKMARRLDSIIDFADIGEAIDKPTQNYSSGMRARLGFAVAVHVNPQLLLVDEVLAVGDLSFQNKCMRHMQDFRARGGTLVFVGHAGHQVQAACDRAIVLDRGECVFDGNVVDALDHYFRQQQGAAAIPVTAGGSSAAMLQLTRAPSQAVTIERVSVRGVHGELRCGRPADVVVDFFAERAHARALLFGAFYSIDGQRALAGVAHELPGGLFCGLQRMVARLPQFLLADGSYQLRLALIDMDLGYPVALKGWSDPAVRITVAGTASAVSNFGRILDIPVMLPVKCLAVEPLEAAGNIPGGVHGDAS